MTESPKLEPAKYFFSKSLKLVYANNSWPKVCFFHFRHTPHVMTLFDRKVDLARFTSTTPIYTMCRDWMSNNPDKLSHHYSNNNRHAPSLSIGSAALNHTGDATPTTPVNDSTHLPAPIPLPMDAEGRVIRLDIPQSLPSHMNGSAEFYKALQNVRTEIS